MEFLLDIKKLTKNQRKKCFISYAWPKDLTARARLQAQLREMRNDLKESGIEAMLDVVNMEGDIDKYMVENIRSCDKFLLVSLLTSPCSLFFFDIIDMHSSTCTTSRSANIEQCSKRTE